MCSYTRVSIEHLPTGEQSPALGRHFLQCWWQWRTRSSFQAYVSPSPPHPFLNDYATGFCLLTLCVCVVCVCVWICVCVISEESVSPYGCDLRWYCQITNYKLYFLPRKSMWQFLCSPPQPFSWKVICRTYWKSSWNYSAVPAVDCAFSELFQCFHLLLGNREVLKYLQEFHRPGSGKYVYSVRAWSCVSG